MRADTLRHTETGKLGHEPETVQVGNVVEAVEEERKKAHYQPLARANLPLAHTDFFTLQKEVATTCK